MTLWEPSKALHKHKDFENLKVEKMRGHLAPRTNSIPQNPIPQIGKPSGWIGLLGFWDLEIEEKRSSPIGRTVPEDCACCYRQSRAACILKSSETASVANASIGHSQPLTKIYRFSCTLRHTSLMWLLRIRNIASVSTPHSAHHRHVGDSEVHRDEHKVYSIRREPKECR